jgi:hypothetical protein
VQLLRDELDRAGRNTKSFQVAIFVPVFAWPDADGWSIVRDAYRFATWKYGDMADARGRRPPSARPPRLMASEEDALRRSIHLGSAEEIAGALSAYEAAADCEITLVVQGYWPGLAPELQWESVAYLAEHVVPLLRR